MLLSVLRSTIECVYAGARGSGCQDGVQSGSSGLDAGARYATGRFQSNEHPAKMLVASEKPERGISLPVKQTDPLPNSAS